MSALNISYAYIFLSLVVAVIAFTFRKLFSIFIQPFTSALRDVQGPPNPSWLYGNFPQIRKSEPMALHQQWMQQYGPTFKFKGWLNSDRLFTIDTRALNHILSHSYDYPKPPEVGFQLAQIVGPGLLIVEGEQHRQQRRILNPAFGPSQIRELTDIFVEKSYQLCDFWNAEIAQSGEPARINVMNGLSRMTLDVIGRAGFNYELDALNLNGKPNELNEAFNVMFQSMTGTQYSLLRVLKAVIPPLRIIPDATTTRTAAAQKVMRRIGMQLIAEKKAEVAKAMESGEKGVIQSRDLLTLLIKANMSTDIAEHQRLSDDDVLAQVPTFLVAGHETTSNATSWCLFSLAQSQDVQKKLREELLGLETDNPTMDELNTLPYLEAVVRETMRFHAPVSSTIRIASKDDVIPLETPYTDVHGQVHESIKISKGSPVMIPILAINKAKSLWGEDADEFKPERWESPPEGIQRIPGVWGHMLSFLGGPRACIGYRFSLVEMKALIFVLIRAFEFDLAIPASEIRKKQAIVVRPYVRSEMEKGSQLPLLIRPYVRT